VILWRPPEERDSLEASRGARFEDDDQLRSFVWKRMVFGFAVRIDQGAVTKTGWQYQRTWCPANINPKHTSKQTYTLIFRTGNHSSWQLNTAQCCGERNGDHNAATYADWEENTSFVLQPRSYEEESKGCYGACHLNKPLEPARW